MFSSPCMLTDVVECGVDTCLSGGTCLELVGGGTHCMCPPGFSGDDCCQSKTPYLLHRTWCTMEESGNFEACHCRV